MHAKNDTKADVTVERVNRKLPQRERKLVKDDKFRLGQKYREERRRSEIRRHIAEETGRFANRPKF